MRLGFVCLAGWLLILLHAPNVVGETIYTYKDLATGRDVYVNRLDQVPVKYRDQARPVFGGDPSKVLINREPSAPAGLRDVGQTMQEVLKEKSLSEIRPATMINMVDQKLRARGCHKVGPEDAASLTRLFFIFVALIVVTSVASLWAWIVLMLHAYRASSPWWMIFMVLFYPLVFVYTFLNVDERKVKYLCLLGLLSPIFVGVAAAWLSVAWLRPVMETCAKMSS